MGHGGGRQGFTAKGGEGKLVRDILDTKDELDKGQKEEAEEEGSKETGIILGRGRKKGGDGVKKEEIQRLREVCARRARACAAVPSGPPAPPPRATEASEAPYAFN